MPTNQLKIRSEGDTTVPDPAQTPGILQLSSERKPSGFYQVYMTFGWDSSFVYTEKGYGSTIDFNALHALTSYDMTQGKCEKDIGKLTEDLYSQSRKAASGGKSGRLANISKLVTLGRDLNKELRKVMTPAQSIGSWEQLDIVLESWLKFVLKNRARYSRLSNHSIAVDDFDFSFIGLQVQQRNRTLIPAFEIVDDDGKPKPPTWFYFMPDHPLDDDRIRRAVVGAWYLLRGVFDRPLSEYDSIMMSIMFEKFNRVGLQIDAESIAQMLYYYMPVMLTPNFLDLDLENQIQAINYMIVLAMMMQRMSNASLSTLIHPVHFQSEGIKYQPDLELLKTTNWGRFRPEPEFGSSGCTFWKPGRGNVTGIAIARNTGKNLISMKLKRNPKRFNTSPDLQYSDTLSMKNVGELNVYNILGLGFKGQVMYINSEDESDQESLLRIVSMALNGTDPEMEAGLQYSVQHLLANLLIGSTSLFKVTDIEFLNTLQIGGDGEHFSLEFLNEAPSSTSREKEQEPDPLDAPSGIEA